MPSFSFDAWSPAVVDYLYWVLNISIFCRAILFGQNFKSSKMPFLSLGLRVTFFVPFLLVHDPSLRYWSNIFLTMIHLYSTVATIFAAGVVRPAPRTLIRGF